VAGLLRDGRLPRTRLRIVFVGDIGDGHDVQTLLPELGLTDVVQVLAPVPHVEALRWMRRADVLLLLVQDQPDQIPAKTFEYLAAGSSVLAVGGEGAMADLVHKVGGYVVNDDVAAIQGVIMECYRRRQEEGPAAPSAPWTRPEVRAYDRRQITGRLVRLLEGRE
jgi:glycosyltransferase involved in cell wall biosynthesis